MQDPLVPTRALAKDDVARFTHLAHVAMLRANQSADPAFVSLHIGDAIATLRSLKLLADTQATLNRARYDRGNAVK